MQIDWTQVGVLPSLSLTTVTLAVPLNHDSALMFVTIDIGEVFQLIILVLCAPTSRTFSTVTPISSQLTDCAVNNNLNYFNRVSCCTQHNNNNNNGNDLDTTLTSDRSDGSFPELSSYPFHFPSFFPFHRTKDCPEL